MAQPHRRAAGPPTPNGTATQTMGEAPSIAEDAKRQAEIRGDLLRVLAAQAPVSLLGSLCVIAYLAWALWAKCPHDLFFEWAAALALVLCAHLHLFSRYRAQATIRLDRIAHWARWLLGLTVVTGGLWACVPLYMLVPGESASAALPLVIAFYTLGAGSVPMMSYHLPSLTTFLILVHVPLGIRLVSMGSADSAALGAATVLYMMVLIFYGRIQCRLAEGFVRTRFEKQDLAESLRLQKEAAEQANLAKSRFFAAASHDLRQPLHALGLYAASLRELTVEAEPRAIVDKVDASIEALGSLFDELLDISKLDAGAVAPRPTHFPVASVLETLRVQFAGVAANKHLRLRVAASQAVVHTDAVLLTRILSNLLSNAIRYTAAGKVLVGCRRRGPKLWVEVWDTGPGIAKEEHERIFEEFYQLDNPQRDRQQGLGLGLATVRRLVALLGLRLRLDSVVGRGSVFRVEVPLGDPAAMGAPAEPTVEVTHVLDGKRIVVVDDEASIRESMQRLLTRWGCKPVVAANGVDALTQLQQAGAPDLIICDFRLAGNETGVKVIAAIRHRHGAQIPAILVTGDTSPERLREALAAGHLLQHKPVRPVQLRAACNHLLRVSVETSTPA